MLRATDSGNPRASTALFLAAVLAGIAVIAATYLRSDEQFLEYFFTSDTLYLPSIYKDVVEGPGCLLEWSLNAAPNFFPDMGLYFLLEWAFGNFRVASYLFPMLQFVLIAVLSRAVVRAGGITRSDAAVALGIVLLLPALLAGRWNGDRLFGGHLLMNSFHMGTLVNTLLCTWLLLRLWQNGRWYNWALLGLAVVAGSASDRLFWLAFTAPAMCSCLLWWAGHRERRPLLFAGWVLCCTALAQVILSQLQHRTPLIIEEPFAYFAFGQVLSSFHHFLETLKGHLASTPWAGFLVVLTLVVSVWLPLSMSLRWRRHGPVVWMAALFMPVVLWAPVLNGSFEAPHTLRYNFPAFVVAALVVGIRAGREWPRAARLLAWAGVLVAGVPALWTLAGATRADLQRLLLYRPQFVQHFDQAVQGAQVRNGVANYWDAKLVTLFSERDVTVLPVYPGVLPYAHVNRPSMFFGREFDFVIIYPPELPKEGIEAMLGPPRGFFSFAHVEVMRTRPWRFESLHAGPVFE